MKTLIYALILPLILVLAQSCQPNVDPAAVAPVTSDESISIDEARQIYEASVAAQKTARVGTQKKKWDKKPKWDWAGKEKFSDGTEAVIVPLDHEVTDYPHSIITLDNSPAPQKPQLPEVFTSRKAVVYKVKGKPVVEYMAAIGEKSYKALNTYFDRDSEFTGALLFTDADDNLLRGFYYDKGKRVGEVKEQNSLTGARLAGCYIAPVAIISTYYTYQATAGGYTSPVGSNGVDTMIQYAVVCDTQAPFSPTMYTYNVNGGGSVSVSSSWVGNTAAIAMVYQQLFRFLGPDNRVEPDKHLKCFGNVSGNTYNITVHVDQPTANSNAALSLNAPGGHVVGHAYLTFEQFSSDGSLAYRRTIGFYPLSGGTPLNPSGPPTFNNDALYSGGWDVQVTFNVTGSDFMTAVGYVMDYGSSNYSLGNRNCGTMCVQTLNIIGINLPTAWSSQPAFYTTTGPGGPLVPTMLPSIGMFGQQLRSWSFQGSNQTAIILNRSNTGGTPPEKAGTCD
jgi:hypothetical protein